MNMKTRIVLFLTVLLLSATGQVVAQDAPDQSAIDPDYLQWLERYDAWDKVESSIAASGSAPEFILKRARIYMNEKQPAKAASLLEQTPPFEDKAMESERLWLGGRAFRAAGEPSKAVLWFSQAGRIMSSSQMRDAFTDEPGLETLWMDVWRRMYWGWQANASLSREAQKMVLTATLQQARDVWNSDIFWKDAGALVLPDENAAKEPVPFSSLDITQADSIFIARALSACALGDFDKARSILSALGQDVVSRFWIQVVDTMDRGAKSPAMPELAQYPKANAFPRAGVLDSITPEDWLLGNEDAATWTRFRDNLLAMPASEALRAVDAETQSMLISQDMLALLQSVKLAFAVLAGENQQAKNIWKNLDRPALPLSLKLAGVILFNEAPRAVLPKDIREARRLFSVISPLASAAGARFPESPNAPFWLRLNKDEINSAMAGHWPLDRLLILADWDRRWSEGQSPDLARRILFLFPETGLGAQAAVLLAKQSIKDKNLRLAEFYAGRIPEDSHGPAGLGSMEVRAMLLMLQGKEEAALKAFNQLIAKGGELAPMTRLKLALLLQQRGDLQGGRDHLLALWQRRAELSTALQAEILFWLGEGQQAMGDMDGALDYYLRLAWKYPQENIWAITAMYRASMIYERRGYFDTAKKLLGTVIKNAATKEQREAAKARLSAIELKMRDQGGSSEGTVEYPF